MSNRFLKNHAFCVLPFIEQFYDIKGKRRLCCHSSDVIGINDTDSINLLRKKILDGQRILNCKTCYTLEDEKTISPRLTESARWLRDPEVSNYIENWDENSPQKIFFYDIRFDNKCNLACISCNPTDSSLWAKELGLASQTPELSLDLDKIYSAKKIYLAGGEPLIIEQFVKLIQNIADLDQQPELVINTNLTKINETLKLMLGKIKNLTLTVSVDSAGSVNEYHRWPMTWAKFVNNLIWASDIGCNLQFNSVVDAISILNIDQLVEIETHCDQWSLNILTDPRALLINNLPERYKQTTYDKFLNIRNSKFYSDDVVFKSRADIIADTILKPGNPQDLISYISAIDQRRGINHKDYLGIQLI